MPRQGRRGVLAGVLSRRAREGFLATAAALLLAAGLTGCGRASGSSSGASSGSSNELVARVWDRTIDRATVDRWTRALERGNLVGGALGQMSGTPRKKALEFLISSSWLVGEAQEQGFSISKGAVEAGLLEKIDAAPNGRSGFEEEIASTGQTLADVKLEVKSILAATALRSAAAKHVPAVTSAEVARYYAHHRRSFYLPDRRVAYLNEDIHDYSRAVAVARRVRPGARPTRPWFREVVSRSPGGGDRERLVNMIFATTPGRVTTPALFNGRWVLAFVWKLIPAGIQPLVAVRGELSNNLAAQHREQALKRFADAFARKWSARTSCSPAYVIQKCARYRGAVTQRNPLTGE